MTPEEPHSSGRAGPISRLQRAVGRLFTLYPPDEPSAGTFRAKQIRAVLQLTPLTMLANVLNALLIADSFWSIAPRGFLPLWIASVILAAAFGARSWFAMRSTSKRQTASMRAMRRATIHASILGTIWAMVPVVLFPLAGAHQQLMITAICAGMICAGGFALATVPVAASAYVLILSAGSAYPLLSAHDPALSNVGLLLYIYAVIVIASVIATARTFGARLTAEAHAEHQAQVIGLLLRDFEENASDVLWEIDDLGRLRHASPRLAQMLDKSIEDLVGTVLVDHLRDPAAEWEDVEFQYIRELEQRLAVAEPFRDLTIPILVAGETQWWSLTAKPLTDPEGRFSGWRGVATDVTHARRAHERITHLAHHDTLTGLANRHQFHTQVRNALLAVARDGRNCAVACIDLDNFKDVNDSLGHHAGDLLLQLVARRLSASTRRNDLVARLGGDEFGLLLREPGEIEEVQTFVDRLLDQLQRPCELDGARINVGASVGLALSPRDGVEATALLRNADFALYAAKEKGRGGFRFFDPLMALGSQRRQMLERELRRAIDEGGLYLRYQPQIEMASCTVTRFEALLRWKHPLHGNISPEEFIPVAESSGLIVRIGEWVLRQACRDAMTWPDHLGVAVNLSPVQMVGSDLYGMVNQILEQTGLPTNRLEVEITESVFINETAEALDQLHRLHQEGISLALDDFGTGYASLAYLRRLPFDTLKIDRSFVHEMLASTEARAIVRSVVDLAATLKIATIAEGVENKSQVDALIAEGCANGQGNYLGEPMRPDAIVGFLGILDRASAPAA